jgi:hypothetical protein
MTRTIPMELVENGEVLVCYGQNGEMLRPRTAIRSASWCRACRA